MVGLGPLSKTECSLVGGHSEDCIGLLRVTSVHGWRWNVLLVGGHSEACIGSPRTASGVIFCRNRNMMERASGPSGEAAAGRRPGGTGADSTAATRMDTARVLEGGRQGGHSVDCIGLPKRASTCLICTEPVQTVEWLGDGCRWKQGLVREVSRHNGVRWQWTSSFLPVPMDMTAWADHGVM